MALSPNEAHGRADELKANSRRNEIISIALFAVGMLFALCLASYNPDDPTWTSAGRTETRNLIGTIGASLATTLFQIFGLAAVALPFLLFLIAWRRFRTARFRAPIARTVGIVLIILAVTALFAVFDFRPIFDASVKPGGLIGTALATLLMSGLGGAGASVLLFAIGSIGVLLATDFSFVNFYERIAAALAPFGARLRALPEDLRAWRAARRGRAIERAEQRRANHAEVLRLREEANENSATIEEDENDSVIVTPRVVRNARRRSVEPQSSEANSSASNEAANAPNIAASSPALLEESKSIVNGLAESETLETARAFAAVNANGATSSAAAPRRALSKDVEDKTDSLEAMMDSAEVVRARTEDEDEMSAVVEPAEARTSRRAAKKEPAPPDYQIPSPELLNAPPPRIHQKDEQLLDIARSVAEKCREFNVTGKIEHICPGPVVTTYEFKPDPGVKYSRVTGLVDDLCLALKAESIRIDRVPGKAHVGIEVPNPERETIYLREIIESHQFQDSTSKLTLALGKTIDGIRYVADLAKMPHLLIAGATGTGKSVCLNAILVSLLYKARPDEVKFILIDPKRLELGLYADIPHLSTPIITEPKRAKNALEWAVREMERRYKELAKIGVRNIDGFNNEIARRNFVQDFDENGEPHKPLPYIVIIIDELADLMMVSGHEVEEAITRLAQMARAVGIHLILATQRPSVDVITGLIKANFPSRIAFRVSSKVDSRTIIDSNGAEQLLGRGDMLFLPPGTSRLVRVHGAYLDETEVSRIVSFIKAQGGKPEYDRSITQSEEEAALGESEGGERDELFEQALRICVEMKRASTSVLQRRLRIGYGRAAAILDAMEREGFIGSSDGSSRPRPVLQKGYETVSHWDELPDENL
jgi:S-DNA-T family DNA segregation ATPase FtsK/SpoIIIE